VLVATLALTLALVRILTADVLYVGFLHLHALVIGASPYPWRPMPAGGSPGAMLW
jgi:hypothetical protein